MVVLTELCTVYHLTTTPTQYPTSHISSFKIEKNLVLTKFYYVGEFTHTLLYDLLISLNTLYNKAYT